MKLRQQMILKVVTGALLLLVAAFGAVVIRDALGQRNPENVLPEMDVYYMGEEAGYRLPATSIRRDSYTWQFIFWTKSRPVLDLELWREIPPTFVNPNSPMDLAFTFDPDEVLVEMAADEGEFVPLSGELVSPAYKGVYAYRVTADWGKGKSVQYYFRIEIPW